MPCFFQDSGNASTEEIAWDIDRMRRYEQQGYPHCYVLALDEAHSRALDDYEWRMLHRREKQTYLLMHAFNPEMHENPQEALDV